MSTPVYSAARSRSLHLRCSDEDEQAFRAAATGEGSPSLTEWILWVLRARIQHVSRGIEKSTGPLKKSSSGG
jgi:uncharacterized protein (DUF1778 family)